MDHLGQNLGVARGYYGKPGNVNSVQSSVSGNIPVFFP